MSILQTIVYTHRIVVVADTATEWRAVDPDSRRLGTTSTSKLAPVPHLPAVLAARGHTVLPQALVGSMLMSPDLDRFINGFPALAEQIMANLSAQWPEYAAVFDAEAELILAGWSSRAGRLRAWHAGKPAGGAFVLREIHGDCYAPPPYADGTTPLTPTSPDAHVAIARRQAKRIRTESDGVAGGDLTIATLTCDGVSVEIVRNFA